METKSITESVKIRESGFQPTEKKVTTTTTSSDPLKVPIFSRSPIHENGAIAGAKTQRRRCFQYGQTFGLENLREADGPGQLFPFNKTRTGTAVMTMAHKSLDMENKTLGAKKRGERSEKGHFLFLAKVARKTRRLFGLWLIAANKARVFPSSGATYFGDDLILYREPFPILKASMRTEGSKMSYATSQHCVPRRNVVLFNILSSSVTENGTRRSSLP